jgi:tRNA A-37 threonylcarbamoyl transferase component Bud32
VSDQLARLSPRQRELLAQVVPDARVVTDMGWGLVETFVLEIDSSLGRLVVKAGGASDGHIARELRAHEAWLEPWVRTGHAPALVFGDAEAKLLVTRYLPGTLVEGTPAQDDPEIYRQAGELLARFHGQLTVHDDAWNDRLRTRVERFLAQEHRIDPEIARRVRREIDNWTGGAVDLVPTHGDWQPRNWLVDDGTVRVIDFGRADLRPRDEDFLRLARQDFARDTRLEKAFLDTYGDDPREPDAWRRARVAEAVATAVWAYGVGDTAFERSGHRQLEVLYPAGHP